MATSVTSVQNFIGNFRKKDPARVNRFQVLIPSVAAYNGIPNGVVPIKPGIVKNFEHFCHVTQLPGKTLATAEQRTYGPIEKHPYLSTYNDIDLTFYMDGDLEIKNYFDSWFNYINNTKFNDFEYKKNYCSNITIIQYDLQDRPVYTVTCIDAYPVSMNQMDLDWNSDSLHSLTVTFAYTYWDNYVQE
jgi:hypothetical protein